MTSTLLRAALTLLIPPCAASGRGREACEETGRGADYVVLLHALGRTALAMKGLEWRLRAEGYRVINVSYPSTRHGIAELADGFLANLLRERIVDRRVRVHFVTHSLGGILLRQYLASHPMRNLGRVVMVAPPNRGSELADRFRANRCYRWLTGPAGQQLGTDAASLPRRLGPLEAQVGVIAGDRSLNPVLSTWLSGPNDGKVSVAATRLDGMRDFLVVHSSHTWLVFRRQVGRATVRFLARGRFDE